MEWHSWTEKKQKKKTEQTPLPQKQQFRSGAVGWLKQSNVF